MGDTPTKSWVEERGKEFVEMVEKQVEKRPGDVMARLRDLMEALLEREKVKEEPAVEQLEGEEEEEVEVEEESPELEEGGETRPQEDQGEGDEGPPQQEEGDHPQGEDA